MASGVGRVGGSELSPEGRGLLERELMQGERVVWACHPAPRVYARGAWVASVFGVVFIGFAGLWFVITSAGAGLGSSLGAPGPSAAVLSLFSLVGLLPLGVGVGLLLLPVWVHGRAARIVYAVTDRRALVVMPLAFGRLSARSFSPVQLGSLERVERADGSGNLVFVREAYSTTHGDGHRSSHLRPVGFIGLADVRGAERVVRGLASRAV